MNKTIAYSKVAAKWIVRVLNAGPTVAYFLADGVVGSKVAAVVYAGATVLDWIVPCVPVGSALTITSFGIVYAVKLIAKARKNG